ncbi:MAG TPA: energy transducer TonB, partial [Pyrinomonadaceae bacterium]|nr:energy transducer TonB [Pyrinomonadaceae bacterium]
TPARLAADAREEMACIEERKRLRPEAAGSHPFVLGGKAIARPKPAYPAEAKAARASGTVTVRLTVDESGRVTDAEVLCGHPLLTAAVREAALRARYSPTLMRGRPVKVQTAVAYTFSLD